MVPSFTRSVTAATKKSEPIGSSHAMPEGAGNWPSSVYGYSDSIFFGKAMWSLVQSECTPMRSLVRANVVTCSAVAWRPRCGKWAPQSMRRPYPHPLPRMQPGASGPGPGPAEWPP